MPFFASRYTTIDVTRMPIITTATSSVIIIALVHLATQPFDISKGGVPLIVEPSVEFVITSVSAGSAKNYMKSVILPKYFYHLHRGIQQVIGANNM